MISRNWGKFWQDLRDPHKFLRRTDNNCKRQEFKLSQAKRTCETVWKYKPWRSSSHSGTPQRQGKSKGPVELETTVLQRHGQVKPLTVQAYQIKSMKSCYLADHACGAKSHHLAWKTLSGLWWALVGFWLKSGRLFGAHLVTPSWGDGLWGWVGWIKMQSWAGDAF